MCGVGEMKPLGSGSVPSSTNDAQSWRESWNCSLIETAFSVLIEPSAPSGM